MKLINRPTTGKIAEIGDDIRSLPFNSLIQRIYAGRGVHSVDELQFNLKQLLPVSALSHVQAAAELLADNLQQQTNILIIGDFDADGATATAVACRALRLMGGKNIDYLVPNRFEYGYGLTPEIVKTAQGFSPDLIVTVDNGVSSIEGVRVARKQGIKVLVTDHHLPGKELPDADVMVNPNLQDDSFPSKALARSGGDFLRHACVKTMLAGQRIFL